MRNSFIRKISYIAVLIIPLVAFPVIKAAASYDVTTPRDVSVSYTQDTADFVGATVSVQFYEIAAMNSDGSFTVVSDYSTFKIDALSSDAAAADETYDVQYLLDHSNADNEITSSMLLDYAGGLADYLADLNQDAVVISPDAECTMTADATGQASGTASMTPGLYLVVADDVKTSAYEYSFSPALAYVPETTSMELKAEKNPLTADLVIEKTLKSYANMTGAPIFVFDVEAVDVNGKVVYSDVISLTFTSAGTKKALVTGIPAGSTVTVTEIYSGAAYDITSSPSVTMVLNSLPVSEEEETTEANVASFENDHNDHLVYSTGVVNHFEVDNSKLNPDGSTIYSWTWSSHADNTDTDNGYNTPSVVNETEE